MNLNLFVWLGIKKTIHSQTSMVQSSNWESSKLSFNLRSSWVWTKLHIVNRKDDSVLFFLLLKKGKSSFTSIAGQAIGLLGIIDFKKAKGPVCPPLSKVSYFSQSSIRSQQPALHAIARREGNWSVLVWRKMNPHDPWFLNSHSIIS